MLLPALSSSPSRAVPPLLLAALLLLTPAAGRADVPAARQAEAARQNNFGTALMNQQLLDKAQAKFAEAYQLDPSLVQALVNRGIALLYLQKIPRQNKHWNRQRHWPPKILIFGMRWGFFTASTRSTLSPWKALRRLPNWFPTTPTRTTFLAPCISSCTSRSRR